MKRFIFSTIFLILIFSGFEVFPQSNEIDSIKITSSWTGLAPSVKSELEIKHKKEGFYAGRKKIAPHLIDQLLKQIDSRETQTLETLDITQAWLDENAEKVVRNKLQKSLPEERDFFINSFRNIALVEKILPRIFESWTDDKGNYHSKWSTDNYPVFEMTITQKNDSDIMIFSQSQMFFMFPNPKLGRAIAALLPSKFANRELLNGDHLADEIGKEIYDEIRDEIKFVETKALIGDKLEILKDRYALLKTEIGFQTSIDVGRLPTDKKYWKTLDFPNWNAELQRKDLPENIVISVSLPYENKDLKGFDSFLTESDKMTQRVLSIPWLSKYIAENPKTKFEIRYVENRSLSPKGKAEFLEDLKNFGANALSSEILSQLDGSIFLQVSREISRGWSYWLILPDNRTVSWQIKDDAGLKWKASDFETLKMHDTKDWFQLKAVISPDGKIESR